MKIVIILIMCIYCLVLIPLCAITPLSIMAFDAPGSVRDPLVWFLFLTFFSIPLLLIVSMIFQGIFFWRKKYKTGVYFAGLPWIPFIILLLLFTFMQ